MNSTLLETNPRTECCTVGSQCSTPAQSARDRTFVPAVDIVEDATEYRIVADVPGAAAGDVEINFERGRLAIRAGVGARGEQSGRRWLLREYGVGSFERTFDVGETVDAERISAEVSIGVLTVHLPKSTAAAPRRISVRTHAS